MSKVRSGSAEAVTHNESAPKASANCRSVLPREPRGANRCRQGVPERLRALETPPLVLHVPRFEMLDTSDNVHEGTLQHDVYRIVRDLLNPTVGLL